MLTGLSGFREMGNAMERTYRNLGYMLLVLLPIFIAGFWIPYFSEFPHFDASITVAVHVHAVLLFLLSGIADSPAAGDQAQGVFSPQETGEDREYSDAFHPRLFGCHALEGVSRAPR